MLVPILLILQITAVFAQTCKSWNEDCNKGSATVSVTSKPEPATTTITTTTTTVPDPCAGCVAPEVIDQDMPGLPPFACGVDDIVPVQVEMISDGGKCRLKPSGCPSVYMYRYSKAGKDNCGSVAPGKLSTLTECVNGTFIYQNGASTEQITNFINGCPEVGTVG